MKWATAEKLALEKRYVQATTQSKQDVPVGTWLAFGPNVRKGDGWKDPHAVLAAVNYVTKCFAMAADGWVSWNGMTQRLEFFYMRKHNIDIFEKSWKEEIDRSLTPNRGKRRRLGGFLVVDWRLLTLPP